MLGRLSIGVRMVVPVAMAVLLLGLTAAIYIHGQASQALAGELALKGVAIATSLAERGAEPLLTENHWELHRLVTATLHSDADVLYAFVTDAEGRVVAHTFPAGFPRQLLEANPAPQKASAQAQLLNTQEGLVRDIAVPILDGQAGVARVGISQRRAQQVLERVRRRFLALALLVLAVGAFVAAIGARLTSRPIRSLAAAAAAVGAGDWRKEVTIRGKDEVAALARTFNTMLAQLRESKTRLEEDAERLEEELQRRKALQQQLIQSAKLAALGTLAAGVAHELNQPLTVIRALAQELQGCREVGDEAIQVLIEIEAQTTRMMDTIAHLRTFSRDARRKKAAVQINAVIKRALGMVGQQLQNRGIALDAQLAEGLPEITANDIQIEQVLLNLLTNARDALEGVEEPRLWIRSSLTVGEGKNQALPWVVVEVSDNGPGIPRELRDRIFEPFFTTKEAGRGTGLGLAVSHGIISDHGGRIELAEGASGATFRIWLPFPSAQAQAAPKEGPRND